MSCYIVTFQTKSEQSLNKVKVSLKSYGSYCPIDDSCWAIKTDKKASQIRDALMNLLETEERVFVVRSGTEAAWFNSYGQKHDEWLKANL